MTFLGLGIAAGLFFIFYQTYNRIIALKESATAAFEEIDIQLDARGKKFDSLINTVKKYMDYEGETLKKITELRSKSISIDANDPQAKIDLENQLSKMVTSGEFSKGLSIQVEAYPDLKANQNMLQLQDEIVSIENKLAYSKSGYNASVQEYNTFIGGLFAQFLVKMFSSLKKDFTYWGISAEAAVKEETRRVEF
jgi:LemA protein